MRSVSMTEAKAAKAKFSGVNLAGSIVSATDFSGADFTQANFSYAIIGQHLLFEKTGRARCFPGADLSGANLNGTDLLRSYLKGVKGLTCGQLIKAKNWEQTARDRDLAWGAEIPELPLYEYIKSWPRRCGE